MIRHLTILVLALLPAANQATSAPTSAPTTASTPSPAPPLTSLDEKVGEVEFDHLQFGDIIAFLRDRTGVNINVNWTALEAAGIDHTMPITAAAADATLGSVLGLILRSADADGKANFILREEEGVVIITTKDDGVGGARRRFAAAPRGDRKQILQTEAALRENVGVGEFVEMGLADVIDLLGDAAHLQIEVNWNALGELKIDKETPVTVHNSKTSVVKLLEMVLDHLGTDQHKLQYAIDGDHLIISTEADLSKK